LFFLQLMKWGILQYSFIRPTTSIAAVVLDFMGLYCVDSWNPKWGHIYITIIQSLSVTVAMYCLIQFYVSVSGPLQPHKPLLKLFSVKAVVFLTFWQATLLSGLSLIGVVKDTKFMTADDINIGIGALAETFEMMLFAFLHLKAFSFKPYTDASPIYSKWKALGHALDPRATINELSEGTVYMWRWLRGQDGEGVEMRRRADLETAFGRTRKYSVQRGDSWYHHQIEEEMTFAGPSEKRVTRDPTFRHALGGYRPVGHSRSRRDTWEDDDDWDAALEDTEHTPLTLRNLEHHDQSIGSTAKPKRGFMYRPVSSLIQEHDSPRVSTDLDTRRLTLDDPPPHSTLHTYKHMRGPELRRMFNQELGMRTSASRLPNTSSLRPPNTSSLQPTKISEKNLYPSLTTNRTQQSSIDEFYDFNETYVHDPHALGKSDNKPKD